MAHGQGNRALESSDGSPLTIERGEAQVKARTTEELLELLVEEIQELKAIIKLAIG